MLLPSIWTCAEDFAPDLNGPNHLAFHIKEMHFWVIKNLSNDQAVSKTHSEFKFKQCIHSQWNQVSRIPTLNPVPWDVKHTCIPSWFSFLNNRHFCLFPYASAKIKHLPQTLWTKQWFLPSEYLSESYSWLVLMEFSSVEAGWACLYTRGTGNETLWNWDLHCSRPSERSFVPRYPPGELL